MGVLPPTKVLGIQLWELGLSVGAVEGTEEASELGQLRLSLNYIMNTSLKHIMNIQEPKRTLSWSDLQEKETGCGV